MPGYKKARYHRDDKIQQDRINRRRIEKEIEKWEIERDRERNKNKEPLPRPSLGHIIIGCMGVFLFVGLLMFLSVTISPLIFAFVLVLGMGISQ